MNTQLKRTTHKILVTSNNKAATKNEFEEKYTDETYTEKNLAVARRRARADSGEQLKFV